MSLEILNSETYFETNTDYSLRQSKRSEARQRVLLRARLHAIDLQADIRVTDLSRSGLRGLTDLRLSIDQPIFISFDDITYCSGTVRWTQDRRIDLKFCKLQAMIPDVLTMDVGTLLGHQEPARRVSANLSAKITLSNASASANIRNISNSGMMIETDMALGPDTQLLISFAENLKGASVG